MDHEKIQSPRIARRENIRSPRMVRGDRIFPRTVRGENIPAPRIARRENIPPSTVNGQFVFDEYDDGDDINKLLNKDERQSVKVLSDFLDRVVSEEYENTKNYLS